MSESAASIHSGCEERPNSEEASFAASSDPISVVEYDGRFYLCWLWPGERVGSAGDGTGAAIIYSTTTGERRVNIGDLIEVAALYDEDEDDA